jgi:hypothetical protein
MTTDRVERTPAASASAPLSEQDTLSLAHHLARKTCLSYLRYRIQVGRIQDLPYSSVLIILL